MSRHWIDHRKDLRQQSPVSFWVHVPVLKRSCFADAWDADEAFDPPLPAKDPLLGYPMYCVEAAGLHLEFASLEEIRHVIEVLGEKNMPTSLQLTDRRAGGMGPSTHWLSRFPGDQKDWKTRQRIVKALKSALADLGRASSPSD